MKQLLTILVFSLIIGCGADDENQPDDHSEDIVTEATSEAVPISDAAQKIGGIETAIVTSRTMQTSHAFPGVVKSTTTGRAVITSPVAGRVARITVSLGQEVQAGQTVAVIESSELAEAWSEIGSAEGNRLQAEASLQHAMSETMLTKSSIDAAEDSLVRLRQMVEAGAFSQAPLQEALNELNDAQSNLLAIQKEQVTHSDQVQRLESLYADGLVSKADLDAARLELAQDDIKFERAKSQLEVAEEAHQRETTIADSGLLNSKEIRASEAEVRDAKIQHDRAIAGEQSARSALEIAKRSVRNAQSTYKAYASGGVGNVGRLELKASITGVITQLEATQGESVDRTANLLVIENLDAVWVTAHLPEKQALLASNGDRVSIRTSSLQGRFFDGIVQIVGGRIDPETRTLPVQCLVTETAGLLKPEMFATVNIYIDEPVEMIAIPSSSVLAEDGKIIVFVQTEEGFERREISLDGEQDGYIGVLGGLEAGETIAVEGAFVIASELAKSELKGHDH